MDVNGLAAIVTGGASGLPGISWTPLLASIPQEAQDSLGAQVSFSLRVGQPDEHARLVEATATNPMLNGETIRIDGASRMAPR